MPDGKFKTFVLTRRQYYSESGIHRAIKQSNAWNNGISDVLSAMSTVSTKGVNFNAFRDYVDAYRTHCDTLWDEYLRPRWARQRLSLYGGKKRVFARFFNNMKQHLDAAYPGRRIVIAYGSAKFAPGGPNEVSVPTSRAYKECWPLRGQALKAPRCSVLHSRHTRVPVAASRPRASPGTIKVDVVNNTTLQKVAVIGSKYALRGVLWSVSRERFVSRDLNAALNIRRNLLERPDILNRSLATGTLVQRVAKRIKPR